MARYGLECGLWDATWDVTWMVCDLGCGLWDVTDVSDVVLDHRNVTYMAT